MRIISFSEKEIAFLLEFFSWALHEWASLLSYCAPMLVSVWVLKKSVVSLLVKMYIYGLCLLESKY